MKKIVALAFLLASLTCMSFVSASIDLQPRDVLIVDNNLTGEGQVNGLYVTIQNNGSDDFTGSFMIMVYTNHGDVAYSFSGGIKSGGYSTAILPYSGRDVSAIQIDSNNDVMESKEDNNYLYYEDGKSQVNIISSWTGLIAPDFKDTLFILPNEMFYSQFSLSELNGQKSIIGLSAHYNAYGFDDAANFSFCLQGQDRTTNPYYGGGRYTVENSYLSPYVASCEWLANSSDSATNYFWLGNFSGFTKGMTIGAEAYVFIMVNSATKNLQEQSSSVYKVIKAVDRIRGDVNDDGVVDQKDLDILTDVVSHGLYNPCVDFKNIYTKQGINYGAGVVLFSTPDILSNSLINIWLNDKTDPLVQGLGIGELMSTTADQNSSSPVYGVKNSFSISGENLSINAPGADLYNVTAQKTDGKLFQSTGRMGEQIKVPVGAKNVRVETVKIKQNLTALTNPNKEISVSLYPNPMTDHLNIKSMTAGNVRIINVSGQTIYAAPLASETELRIDSKSWASGIYIVNITSPSGKKSMKIIK